MAIRNFKYKLYVSKHTKKLSQLVTSSNFAWNHVVELSRRYYRLYNKSLPCNTLQKHMAKLRKHNQFWSKLGSQTMQAICQKYADALNAHFKHGRGFPRPHKKFWNGSFIFKQGVGYSLFVDENKKGKSIGVLVVNSLGKNKKIKFKITRPWGNVKTISILRDTDNCLYLIVTCDVEVKKYEPKEDRSPIGIDFGLKCFLTLSNGDKKTMPDYNKEQKKKVSQADRSYTFKKKAAKYGTNFKRAKKTKSKAHRKEANQRSDFHWKLAHELCKEYNFIAIEDLNLDGMKRLWGRKVSNLAYGEFIQKLMIVAEKYGTDVVKVERFFASSQTCSDCGYVNKELKNLNIREWVCPCCGVVHDRDVNAAKNVLSSGLSLKKSNMGRALPISEEVINRVGDDFLGNVEWRSFENHFIGNAEQESHGL